MKFQNFEIFRYSVIIYVKKPIRWWLVKNIIKITTRIIRCWKNYINDIIRLAHFYVGKHVYIEYCVVVWKGDYLKTTINPEELTSVDLKEWLEDVHEKYYIELKKAQELPNAFWESYSSFSNTSGGWIILGVEEGYIVYNRV